MSGADAMAAAPGRPPETGRGSGSGWGWFGKAPGAGDFLRRGLSPEFVAPWDAFLQRLLTEGREALGPGWRDAYFAAPIWRFALAPGLCGPRGAAGVLMPSVDRVGREFPLTLAAETGAPPGPAYRAAAPLFAALEDAALAMLDFDAPPARLAGALAALPLPADDPAPDAAPPIPDPPPGGSLWAAEAGGALRVLRLPGLPSGPADAAALFAPEGPPLSAPADRR